MFLRVTRHACLITSRGQCRPYSLSGSPIDISPEIKDALQRGSPVVALESTIITHGMPHPTNLETALSVESKVRSAGSTPATIGILNGRIIVGLQRSQLEILADGNNLNLVKHSRRDLAAAIGLGRSGGTTIAATSLIASLVGIRVFATGGLGGVHRGGELSWDVSADLTEVLSLTYGWLPQANYYPAQLGRTPIAVVSAGVKSILDIGRTLEYLETQGVAVVTYGPTFEFPGFYSPKTGYKSPWRVDSPEAAARIISAGQRLGLNSGILFAAPIPKEHDDTIQEAVDRAVKESEDAGFNKRGKEATPWILRRVAELTQGRSTLHNIALIENTAFIGGRIAREYAKLEGGYLIESDAPRFQDRISEETASGKTAHVDMVASARFSPATLLVIGASALDVISQPQKSLAEKAWVTHSTSPGRVEFSSGGVARNIAEAAHRILSASHEPRCHQVLLISPIGNDLASGLILDHVRKLDMRTDGFLSSQGQRSAVCNMYLDMSGNLTTGVADMSIVDDLGPESIIEVVSKHQPRVVAFDANLNSDTLAYLIRFCGQRHIPTFFEPTSVSKSVSILPALSSMMDSGHLHASPVTFASPNQLELLHLFREVRSLPYELTSKPYWWSVIDSLGLEEQYHSDLALLSRQTISTSQTFDAFLADGVPQMAISLLPFFQHLFIKCGDKVLPGVFVAMRVIGEAALSSGWSLERTQPEQRQLVAKGKDGILVLKHYPALYINPKDIVNVTGAGDSFVGALLTAISQADVLSTPQGLDDIVEQAQRASLLSLLSSEAVSPLLSSAKSK